MENLNGEEKCMLKIRNGLKKESRDGFTVYSFKADIIRASGERLDDVTIDIIHGVVDERKLAKIVKDAELNATVSGFFNGNYYLNNILE